MNTHGDMLVILAEKLGLHPAEIAVMRYGDPENESTLRYLLCQIHNLEYDPQKMGHNLADEGILTAEEGNWLDSGTQQLRRNSDCGASLPELPADVTIGPGHHWPSGKPLRIHAEETEQQLQATAYHEAGHAVMALLLKKRFSMATIEPGEDFLGMVAYSGLQAWESRTELLEYGSFDDLGARDRSFLERDIMVSLAGPVAEAIYLGAADVAVHLGGRGDYQKILDLVTRFMAPDEAQPYVKWLEERAKTRLENPISWRGVTAVAECLLEEKTLTRNRVKSAVAADLDEWKRGLINQLPSSVKEHLRRTARAD